MAGPKLVAEVSWGSIASIVTILATAIGVVQYVARIDAKTDVNSTRIVAIEERISRQDAASLEAKREQAARLDRIENKIDSLLREMRLARGE